VNRLKLLSTAALNKYEVHVLFEESVGALPIKPIYHTQRLNPAACCYKPNPYSVFLQPQKGKQN
jgi:hypothetical protein